jgi:hypothetical protein
MKVIPWHGNGNEIQVLSCKCTDCVRTVQSEGKVDVGKEASVMTEGRDNWNGFGENESDVNDGDRRAKNKEK